MSEKHPCLDVPPHLKRVERPEDIPQPSATFRRLLGALARLRRR